MKYLQLIIWGLGSLFLAAEAGGIADEKFLSSGPDGDTIYHNDFKCPFPFGAFPDPEDCAYYQVCFGGIAVRRKCGWMRHFDKFRRVCLPKLVAICGHDKDKTKTTSTEPDTPTETTKIVDNFKCSKMFGSFPHQTDCSKYYTCKFYMSSLKICPDKQLFDAEKSTCRPENEVNCGNRERPGFTTTAIPTEPIVTEAPETSTTEEEIIASTPEDIISTEEVTAETITEVSSTTIFRPTGPPDHTCDEEDVDCIITETGNIQDWFICPRDIGSFPHPSSDKLFIFCMNWIPSVKKCGQDLVYSKEHTTCVEKKNIS